MFVISSFLICSCSKLCNVFYEAFCFDVSIKRAYEEALCCLRAKHFMGTYSDFRHTYLHTPGRYKRLRLFMFIEMPK